MEVLKTELCDLVESNYDKDLPNRSVSDDNCSKSEDEVRKDRRRELHDVVTHEDSDKEQDVTNDNSADGQQVIENTHSNKEQEVHKIGSSDDCSKEQNVVKDDSCSKDVTPFGDKQQNVINDEGESKEQDIVDDDSSKQKNRTKEDIQCKEQENIKSEDCIKQQDEESVNDDICSSNISNSQLNESTENKEICNVKSEENKHVNEQITTIKKEANSDSEDDSHLPCAEQNTDNSTKLSELKGKDTRNVRKLREVSQVLRNKRRSRQREQIHTRHRSSSKDTAKLLKRRRSVSRQSSTCQDDDQSVHSGTKRKRIPNRPGISFEVGARIEAKDYLDKWYPSKIIAVDEEEAEVLIHFERWSARFDEWMPMESPRIRAITHPSTRNEQKEKTSKVMPQYKAGEAVLARWTDCKMYPAKVLEVGANNCYEVLFYDGFHRTVQSLNIEKLPKEMTNKVNFPTVSKLDSPERKKPNSLPKDPGKPPPKKVDKIPKDRTVKRDHNDLTSILGKRKRLIVGGIFQAKRNKSNDEKSSSNSKQKCRKVSLPEREVNLENLKSEEVEMPPSPVGYIDGRKIARKEFIIEEDHNHFKCPIPSCGKSFRKDKLLQSHMKHYHDDSRNREKKKASPSLIRESKTVNLASLPLSPTNDKATEKEEKTEVIKTKLKSPMEEEVSKDFSKSVNTQLTTSPKASSKPNSQENLKGKGSKSSRTDAKHTKINTISEAPIDNKASAVRFDGRVTRSERLPKIEQKTTRTETRSSKSEGKLVKTENKNVKTENRISKADCKVAKVENKVTKIETKTTKGENKTVKNENKTIKSENKTIKTENKPVEERTEKSKLGQENKIAEEIPTVQPSIVAEDTKKLDSGMIITMPSQGPVLPMENGHTSRSKKRRTISASEVGIDAAASVDSTTHSVMTKEMDIKSEKLVDVENLQDDVKPLITDTKSTVQEDEPEDGQSDEIVHCICNCIEENGLMMQCEVCLTWQHGTCFDIDDVKEVPDKYVCYACLKPIGLRESFRYRHDLDWFNKGEMTTFSFLDEKPSPSVVSETLSAHDLVASLHNIIQVLHSLQIKLKFAKEDNHPELIMWRKPWMDYSYLHCQDVDNNEELVQPARADFDHSYFSVKEDILATTNALNTRRSSYDKATKRENTSSAIQDGETSQCFDRNKASVNCTKNRTTDKERISCKQQSVKTEIKPNIEFDPIECKKNLLDHLLQMQHGVEQQLSIIEEHLQVLESEMGIPTLSDEDLHKEMGKSLCTIRKLMKDLSFVQQLTNFQ